MELTIPQISEFFSTFLSSGGRFNTFVESRRVNQQVQNYNLLL